MKERHMNLVDWDPRICKAAPITGVRSVEAMERMEALGNDVPTAKVDTSTAKPTPKAWTDMTIFERCVYIAGRFAGQS
jgi:hypothetical protein